MIIKGQEYKVEATTTRDAIKEKYPHTYAHMVEAKQIAQHYVTKLKGKKLIFVFEYEDGSFRIIPGVV